MRKELLLALIVCLAVLCGNGCKTFRSSNASACRVGFDYADTGVNERNARALLVHYCICNPGEDVCPG